MDTRAAGGGELTEAPASDRRHVSVESSAREEAVQDVERQGDGETDENACRSRGQLEIPLCWHCSRKSLQYGIMAYGEPWP